MGVKDPRLRPIAVGRDRPRSTIHTVEVDVSAFRRRAVRSISSVWMVSCTAELFLGAPFRLGPACLAHESGVLVPPPPRGPLAPAGGRVGFTPESRGCSGGRPRCAGTPVPDEHVPAGCHATGCGPVPTPAATHVQDRRSRDTTLIFGRYVPVMAIRGLPRAQARPAARSGRRTRARRRTCWPSAVHAVCSTCASRFSENVHSRSALVGSTA
jgi:hypothetical protein